MINFKPNLKLLADLKELFEKYFRDYVIYDIYFEGKYVVVETRDVLEILNSIEDIQKLAKDSLRRWFFKPILKELKSKEETYKYLNFAKYKVSDFIFKPNKGRIFLVNDSFQNFLEFKTKRLEIYNNCGWILSRTPKSIFSKTNNLIEKFFECNIEKRRVFLRNFGNMINSGKKSDNIEIVTICGLGGFSEIGRSCYYIKTDSYKIILEAGIKISKDTKSMVPQIKFSEIKFSEIDCIIISHAHLDHGGLIPILYNGTYNGPILMTKPTRTLLLYSHIDFFTLQKNNFETDIFSQKSIQNWILNSVTFNFNENITLSPNINLKFINSGHIIGSGMVVLRFGRKTFLFTGDYKYGSNNYLLPSISFKKKPVVDVLLSEGTYCCRDRIYTYNKGLEKLSEIINNTIKNYGFVLIPSFAIGRAQELLNTIHYLLLNEQIPKIPVYIEKSIWETTMIYKDFFNFLNNKNRNNKGLNFLNNDNFIRIVPGLKIYDVPGIIISTSGMMEGGAIVKHFVKFHKDENSSVILVGFQMKNSLGYNLKENITPILLKHKTVVKTIKPLIKIHHIDSFSAHSSHKELLDFIRYINPETVILTHGIRSELLKFKKILERNKKYLVYVPKNLETIRII